MSAQDENLKDESTGAPADNRPNILILWGDDIGWWNLSCYNDGMMGYQTPNIDRIAAEGARFQGWYGENSCTAGRAAFITGQAPVRTGLTKVGLPGAKQGLSPEDPTIAELLKPLGYATGQFGKNHLGDRNEFLPTVHGFDEFFGNLYHLNAEEEPENPDWPSDPRFNALFRPRGVLHTFATDVDDTTDDGRFGPVGKQTIEDTGPLTRKRMETIDEEVCDHAEAFIRRAANLGQPFFCWWNSTRMHANTRLRPESAGVTGLGFYADGMVETDGHVGRMLDLLDELGVADNTIVMYSTDNGAQLWRWPDGAMTPFHGQKSTVWEGGFRVPCVIRWPRVIEPATVSNDPYSHCDMLPTLLAAAGQPYVKERLLEGWEAGDKSFKVHLDGYNMLPYWTGAADDDPRREFLYWTDDGDLGALRYDRWKAVFIDQRGLKRAVWGEPPIRLRGPMLFDLLADPFERAQQDSSLYDAWASDRNFLVSGAQAYVSKWISSFQEFPPRQKPASFSIDQVMEELQRTDSQ
ncbi:MAG: arylsulfatase [Thermomicrobiales bacterium]